MVDTSPRRQQIEAVASALFRERGYAATSVRDIARAMDLQGASLYAQVESKEDMLWSIVQNAADRFEAVADEVERNPGTATERVADFVRRHVRVITHDPGAANVFIQEWRLLATARREATLNRRDDYEAWFRGLIQEGVEAGEFSTTDSALAATYILSALNALAGFYRPDGRLTADHLADVYSTLALRTLGVGSQTSEA